MDRVILAAAALAVVSGGAWADPPSGAGKERTHLEQELHLPEPPTPKALPVAAPRREPEPTTARWVVDGVRAWLLGATAGQLGVAPLVKCEVW